MSTDKTTGTLSDMHTGDVLVSHRSAVLEHEISIVPAHAHGTATSSHAAMIEGAAEARELGVDGWATEDLVHVVKIAAHRPEPTTPDEG